MPTKEQFLKALKELRKEKKRNFNQTVDLIINLKEFDVKRDSINIAVMLQYPAKKHKICAFLEKPSIIFDYVVAKKEFERISEKELKKIVKDYDFCVALAKLMPDIAKRFGRLLGTAGKMPDPKIGCVIAAEDNAVMSKLAERLRKTVKIKTKEKSVKIAIGKESMSDDQISENAAVVYDAVLAALPKKKASIKNVMFKFTMSKPVKVEE